jgi:hypothetical protein
MAEPLTEPAAQADADLRPGGFTAALLASRAPVSVAASAASRRLGKRFGKRFGHRAEPAAESPVR